MVGVEGGNVSGVVHNHRTDVWLVDATLGYVRVTSNEPFCGDDATALLDALEGLAPSLPIPVIADIRALRRIDLDVRKIMASQRAGQIICAAGVVVSNALNRMIGNFFMRLNHPPFEMQLFESEDEAAAWARGVSR